MLQRLEEYEVRNPDKKEQIIIRYGEFATMMQHKEGGELQKLIDKKQKAMASTPTGKALLLVQHVLFFHHLLHSYIPQNLGVTSRVTTLAMDSMFFSADHLICLQAVSRVAGKMPLWV